MIRICALIGFACLIATFAVREFGVFLLLIAIGLLLPQALENSKHFMQKARKFINRNK